MFNNCNGKIWVFANHKFSITLVSENDQQLSLILCNQSLDLSFPVTIVYTKCDRNLRLDLWDGLLSLSNDTKRLWILGGDFNVVLSGEETIGGFPVTADDDTEDFNNCIGGCDVMPVQHNGSPFTWWNGKWTVFLKDLIGPSPIFIF